MERMARAEVRGGKGWCRLRSRVGGEDVAGKSHLYPKNTTRNKGSHGRVTTGTFVRVNQGETPPCSVPGRVFLQFHQL